MAARPRSAHTEARSFSKLWLNTVRLPTGLPFGLPETPGGHIRPFTCLLGSKAISSVSFFNWRTSAGQAALCGLSPSKAVAVLKYPLIWGDGSRDRAQPQSPHGQLSRGRE